MGTPPAAAFDPGLLRESGPRARLMRTAIDRGMRAFFWLMRACFPVVRVAGCLVAARRDDVEAILADTAAFHVRFGQRVQALMPADSPMFGLGADTPDTYAAALRQVSAAMPLADPSWLAAVPRACVEAALPAAGRADLGQIARLTQAEVGRHYFGLDVADEDLADLSFWLLAIGNYAFGPQKPDSDAARAGRAAGTNLAAVIARSIAAARAGAGRNTVIARMVAAGIDDAMIGATVSGLLTGLIPGATMAITNVAQVLLARPEAMRAAREAAKAGDDSRLQQCLAEALRFRPIFPGAFRECVRPREFSCGIFGTVTARTGDLVLPASLSAMFDKSRVDDPRRFNPDRPAADSMVFGFGPHWCVGAAVGRVQLVETLKPFLRRGFRRGRDDAASDSYFGVFLEHFMVQLG